MIGITTCGNTILNKITNIFKTKKKDQENYIFTKTITYFYKVKKVKTNHGNV